ncbi:hypothetical protein [Antribacter gilvus]|uniref:hypothetical protein n=1 Tax=Antribacter gilvus TaxID=2304675 RepID=UPI000F770720|nr:hypothetical protein [Antribacter gilvus]
MPGLLRGLGALAVTLALGASAQVPSASAEPVTFDPGYIITDALFWDSGAMSAAQVDEFVRLKGSDCVAVAGSTCLKDFRESTPSRTATSFCPGGYSGRAGETASAIVARTASSCRVNPQVLLVMLQKEQGLVISTTGRPPVAYERAMGFRCPTTGVCEPQYAGFSNQVWHAAARLRQYAAEPASFTHQTGRWNTIAYHPDAACGASDVLIRNQATAGLYNYTPYQPNAAAIAAGNGTGDACSSYGNRNFFLRFTEWFGQPVRRLPIGRVDVLSSPRNDTVRVAGWALDPDTVDPIKVHVYVDGRLTAATTAAGSRPDVQAVYRRGAAHGFDLTLRTTVGQHTVCVYAIDSTGGPNPRIGCGTVQVATALPHGHLDAATTSAGSIVVRGWAADPDTSAPIRVHVYVDGVARRAVTADLLRPDVQRVFGNGDRHGFHTSVTTTPGTHTVCVYAIDTAGGPNPRIGCASVTVAP